MENMIENPNLKFWTGKAPIIDNDSVQKFVNDIFFYKIPANPCVIKLGNLIKMEKKSGAGAAADFFILEFGNKDTGDSRVASDIEFDSITLTLSQNSIDERIRTGHKDEDLPEGESGVSDGDVNHNAMENVTSKPNAMENVTSNQGLIRSVGNVATSAIGLGNSIANTGIGIASDTVTGVNSAISGTASKEENEKGGGKRSMMSSFSRQFELPMPCHAKKRRSRSKKSRGGRRKKGKHTRKHHK